MGRPHRLHALPIERARGWEHPGRAHGKRVHAMYFIQGPIATARFPRNQNGFVVYTKNIRDKLKGNQALPNPNPPFAVYDADVNALDDAQTAAKDGSAIALADRDAKALKVFKNTGHLVDYVQSVADSLASHADAVAVIVGAGLDVQKPKSRKKPELAAKYTGISGDVLLAALAIPGAGAYYWEVSVDQKIWSTVPETKLGKTTVTGLTPGQVYYFRFRALTRKGKTDYSLVVSLMVH
jgi:hypothetical protein